METSAMHRRQTYTFASNATVAALCATLTLSLSSCAQSVAEDVSSTVHADSTRPTPTTGPFTEAETSSYNEIYKAAVCVCRGLLGDPPGSDFGGDGMSPTSCQHSYRGVRPENIAGMLQSSCHNRTGGQYGNLFCTADFYYCVGHELDAHAHSLIKPPPTPRIRTRMLARSREMLLGAAHTYLGSIASLATLCAVTPIPTGHTADCARLTGGTPSYAPYAWNRLTEVMDFAMASAREEVAEHLQSGDAVQPRSILGDAHLDAVWGVEGARTYAASVVYGSPRIEGVDYGRPIAIGRRTLEPTAYTSWPLFEIEQPRAIEATPGVRRALELLPRHRSPYGAVSFGSGTPQGYDINRLELVEGVPTARLVYHHLDHAIAASLMHGPYADPAYPGGDALRAGAPLPSVAALAAFHTSPLAAEHSPLSSIYHVSENDIRTALSIAADIATVDDRAFDAVTAVTASGNLRLATITRFRSEGNETSPVFRSALAQGRSGYADPRAHQMHYAVDHVPGGNFYALNNRQGLGIIGVAGAMQMLRVHLLRLSTLSTMTGIDEGARVRALGLAENALGNVWFESNWRNDAICDQDRPGGGGTTATPYDTNRPLYTSDGATCVGCNGPGAVCSTNHPEHREERWWDVNTNTNRTALWDLYVRVGTDEETYFSTGYVLAFRREDLAQCLARKTGVGCSSYPSASPTFVSDTVPAELGGQVRRIRYALPALGRVNVPTTSEPMLDGHWLMVWVQTNEAGVPTEARLLDTFDRMAPVGVTTNATVHAFGGTLSSLYERVMERDALDPGRPATNALGIPTAFVPPLENELTQSPNQLPEVEDSWRTYLARATASADNAATRLERARDAELAVVQQGRNDQATLALAANTLEASLSELCGDAHHSSDCKSERVSATPLQLGFAHDVPNGVNDYDEYPEEWPYDNDDDISGGCTIAMPFLVSAFPYRSASDDLNGDTRDAIIRHLRGAMECVQWQAMGDIERFLIEGLPARVVVEVLAEQIGDYPDVQGQLKKVYINVHDDLSAARAVADDIAHVMAAFNSRMVVARAQLDDVKNQTERARLLCRSSATLGAIKSTNDIAANAIGIREARTAHERNAAQTVTREARENVDDYYAAVYSRESGQIIQSSHEFTDSMLTSCDVATPVEQRHVAQLLFDAMSDIAYVQTRGLELRRTVYRLVGAGVVLDALEADVEATRTRAALQRQISLGDSMVNLAPWRVAQQSEAVRARRALQRAQTYAFVARRAIEFRLATDMTLITRDEPFVEAPARWVVDLIGAAKNPGDEGVSFLPEALREYATNLEDFVNGYGFQRRFAEGQDMQTIDARSLLPAADARPFYARLLYKCRDHEALLLAGTLDVANVPDEPCDDLGGVEYARFDFYAYTEGTSYFAGRLAADNRNYRYERVALNFVGSGLRNCAEADNPNDCIANHNLRYSLEHSGDVMASNLDGGRIGFAMPTGQISRAHGLARDVALAIPIDSVDYEYLTPYFRYELWGRPIEAMHTVVIEGRPEIVWSNLTDVQLVIGYRYWTSQER